ncbi:hypothetical protein PM082_000463 [Marasmius tenuissimus]|nr:hypothetical protein PM082_000463 [Marasmius tenuissimus]
MILSGWYGLLVWHDLPAMNGKMYIVKVPLCSAQTFVSARPCISTEKKRSCMRL